MKAVRVENGAIEVREVDEPVAGPEEAVVRISATGVCHSDLHLARGDWFGVPLSGGLGHEAIGVVESLGAGAQRYARVGDRVILGLGGMGGHWCGACEYCLGGRPRLCPQATPVMGTFAERIAIWAPSLVAVPEGLDDREAPLACGGLTAYGALKKVIGHGVPPGRPVAVIGAAGGLGHYGVQLAEAVGYQVVAVDVGEERLEFARSLGATRVVGADEAVDVVRSELGGVDAALVFAARLGGFELGLRLLRPGGLFVAVGIPPASDGPFALNMWDLFLKDPTIVYSAVGTVQDMRELVALAAAGRVRTHVSREGSLSDVGAILADLQAGAYLGRAVITDLGH